MAEGDNIENLIQEARDMDKERTVKMDEAARPFREFAEKQRASITASSRKIRTLGGEKTIAGISAEGADANAERATRRAGIEFDVTSEVAARSLEELRARLPVAQEELRKAQAALQEIVRSGPLFDPHSTVTAADRQAAEDEEYRLTVTVREIEKRLQE